MAVGMLPVQLRFGFLSIGPKLTLHLPIASGCSPQVVAQPLAAVGALVVSVTC